MESKSARARQVRAVRGVASAAISTTVAATAHTLAGGGAPPWWLVLAATLLAAPLAVALAGDTPAHPPRRARSRRRSPRRPGGGLLRTASVVLVAQGVLHVAFASIGSRAPHAATGHHATAHTVPDLAPLAAGDHVHLDAGMIVAHIAAAAVTVFLLARGEAILARIGRGLRRLLRTPARRLPQPSLPLAAARDAAVPAAVFLLSLRRRGPPALAR